MDNNRVLVEQWIRDEETRRMISSTQQGPSWFNRGENLLQDEEAEIFTDLAKGRIDHAMAICRIKELLELYWRYLEAQ